MESEFKVVVLLSEMPFNGEVFTVELRLGKVESEIIRRPGIALK